jgi:hypothetical protein
MFKFFISFFCFILATPIAGRRKNSTATTTGAGLKYSVDGATDGAFQLHYVLLPAARRRPQQPPFRPVQTARVKLVDNKKTMKMIKIYKI